MGDTERMVFYEPKLLLAEESAGRFSIVFQHGDGTVERLPATTPAKDLIAAAEIDYRPYRREIKRLRDEHPLFAARLDIPVADFEDFVAEVLLLPSMLQKIDPVGFFALGILLDQALRKEDDGSALFLLDAAQELLHVLEEPIRTQVYLWNILEMAFDGMERASQRERFERLCRIYPWVGKICDPASLPDAESGQTIWQKRVASDITTDPETCYPETFQCLDLRAPDAKWEVYKADDLRRREQRGHQSLRERYGKS